MVSTITINPEVSFPDTPNLLRTIWKELNIKSNEIRFRNLNLNLRECIILNIFTAIYELWATITLVGHAEAEKKYQQIFAPLQEVSVEQISRETIKANEGMEVISLPDENVLC